MKSKSRPIPSEQVSFETLLLVGRVCLWNERDVGLMPELIWQISHLRFDTVFALRPITAVLPSVAISVLVMAVRRYRVIKLIVQIVRHVLRHLIAHLIRIIFFGQQFFCGSHHAFHNVSRLIFVAFIFHNLIFLFCKILKSKCVSVSSFIRRKFRFFVRFTAFFRQYLHHLLRYRIHFLLRRFRADCLCRFRQIVLRDFTAAAGLYHGFH